MDRALGKNLEALAEEDDEEEEHTDRSDRPQRKKSDSDDSDTESDDSDDDFDPEIARGEPNKFEGLSDGVLNAMALVHVSLLELMDLKDDLLEHSLPPTVLVKLALTSARVFRSISDMNMPVNELVRLVRVYSTPWEEKSAALKKLHEDYESKQRQLNIAIKRLQLVDAHSKRIAKEKRIMNWEKLFSKVTTTKGHGRRWKFLIEKIKQKAKMGLEHVQEYTRALEQASDSEEGEEDMMDTTKATESSPEVIDVPSEKTESESPGEKEDEEEEDWESEEGEQEVPTVPIMGVEEESEEEEEEEEEGPSRASTKKVWFQEEAPPPVIKPPMRDSGADTSDPDYDVYLHVRIFCPEDINHRGLKCSVTYGDQMYKTGILDWEEKEEPPAKKTEAPKGTPRPQAAGKGRSSPDPKLSAPAEEEENKYGRYEEFMVRLPDEVPYGALVVDKSITDAPKNVQIAVHHGQFEEIIAMTTLELADLKELDLRTVYLPPPKGDDDVPKGVHSGRDDDLLSLSDSVDLNFDDDDSEQGTTKPRDDPVKGLDPLPFPLFSLQGSRSDAISIGNLPLILYWGKKRRPSVFNRQTGTLGINEVVYDLTGIDLNTTTKEDLHKDMRDQALSAIEFTPEPQEETVAKTELEDLEQKHSEEIAEMKETYEKQLKALMENISQLEEDRAQLLEQQQNMRVVSAGSRSSASPQQMLSRAPSLRRTPVNSPEKSVLSDTDRPVSVAVPMSPAFKHKPLPPSAQKPKKNFRIGRPLPKWGEALPQDFLERLRLYEEESKQHMAELNERTLREIRDSLEKKLAGQHRLSKREEAMYDALKDVSLPALFMPFRSGTVFNPRAHQYFHPTGSTDLRLTQPPSMFQLPPLTKQNQKLSVVNLFELSSNFSSRDQSWLMERYIQQQQPLSDNFNQSAVQSSKPPNYGTQNSQLTDSGLEGPASARENPVLPQEQEVES